jgi:asparagine synthase (glutamine-hydrolysing)
MSGQSGLFAFDGRPVSPELLDALDRCIESRGPDGGGRFTGPGIALSHRAFHITEEDRFERQPCVSHGLVLTWDGRLDNREDLLTQVRALIRGDATDVAIAMACIARWGEEGLARLIGDWSLSVWDPEARELLLACDYMGTRPLYYHIDTQRIVWSSCLEPLVRMIQREDDLDPRYIAGFLMVGPPPELTPYRHVLSVPSGHVVRVGANGSMVKRRYWDYDASEIRYQHRASYEEHFRQLFRTAVKDRLRVDGPIWAELSGGWDSSAVVCMAASLVRAGEARAGSLRTVSHVNPRNKESDETRFIQAVEAHCGITGSHLDTGEASGPPLIHPESPVPTHRVRARELALVSSSGGRLVLTGRGGDATLGNYRDYSISIADHLHRVDVPAFIAEGRAWSRATEEPFVRLAFRSLAALLPPRRYELLQRRRQIRRAGGPSVTRKDGLAEAFCIHPSLATRFEDVYPIFTTAGIGLPPSKRPLLRTLRVSAGTRHFAYPAVQPYVEFTHPYIDRRLVEYVLAIPTQVWCQPGLPRALMRRALDGLLPPAITQRMSKGYATPSIVRGMRSTVDRWVRATGTLEVVRRSWIDEARLQTRLERVRTRAEPPGNLSLIIALEEWLHVRRRETASARSVDRVA